MVFVSNKYLHLVNVYLELIYSNKYLLKFSFFYVHVCDFPDFFNTLINKFFVKTYYNV